MPAQPNTLPLARVLRPPDVTEKAMRPGRRQLWRSAYQGARKSGAEPARARAAASLALKRHTADQAHRTARAALAAVYKAGERIAGQLCRNASGLYVNCNDRTATPESKRALRKQETATERAGERTANIDQAAGASGLNEDAYYGLMDFAGGGALDGEQELLDAGLIEQASDGSYRMTPTGRRMVNAAERGDSRDVADAVSAARDRVAQRQQRASDRKARQQERERARQQRLADRAARQTAAQAKKPKKGGGGGGGGGKNDSQAERRRQEIARRRQELEIWRELAALGLPVAPATKAARAGFQVFKASDGQWWWVAVSSTAFADRDDEIVSVKALADDCARADADGDYGPLRWWHLPGVDIGDCRFNAMSGRSLIELGTFRHPALARAAAKAAPDLELSIGFKHLPDEPAPLAPGQPRVYTYIRRFERSLTPRGRASNPFTAFAVTHKELPMDQAKLKAALEKLGGSPEARAVMQQIIADAQTREKEAEQLGVAFKAAHPDAPPWAQALAERLGTLEEATKAPMPADEMIDAGLTEAADGAERAAEETGSGGEETGEFLGDMSPDAFMALLDAWWDQKSSDMTAKMSEIDNQLKGMGYERRMKEQGDGLAALAREMRAVHAVVKELNGDAPEARKTARGHKASEDNEDLDALIAAALKADGDDDLDDSPLASVAKFLTAVPVQPAA